MRAATTRSTGANGRRPISAASRRPTRTGRCRFTTVYPGWYQGRATHIHVEVTRNGQSLKVTQIAFPDSVNNEVYGSGVYASRGSNPTTNTRDGIFADSINSEMASVAGNPSSGYSATFTIGLTA